MPIVFKSGSLNLLETSGPVQACNGIPLPLPYMPKEVYKQVAYNDEQGNSEEKRLLGVVFIRKIATRQSQFCVFFPQVKNKLSIFLRIFNVKKFYYPFDQPKNLDKGALRSL